MDPSKGARMTRSIASAILAIMLAGAATAALLQRGPAPRAGRFTFGDDFERGLCTGICPGAAWAIRQQERGTVAVVPAPARPGMALRASAAAKAEGVSKADLVARTMPMPEGTLLTVAFDLYAPRGTPLNSIQLLDVECATCGEAGNPGIRLYLRRGRLRIDRSKIGIASAWTRDDATPLVNDRWYRIMVSVRIGAGDDGGARVTLDGREVLAATGATIMPLARRYADRIQIGATANSNAVPVTLYLDNVRVTATPTR
jgi:hypothetical protein